MKLVMLNEIENKTTLVRFVEKEWIHLSIGERRSGELHYSFPLGLLTTYKKLEGNAGDPNEGSTIIALGEKKGLGKVTTCNDALVSCWSICSNPKNPWKAPDESSFAKDRERYPFAIITTVDKVKQKISKILEALNINYHDNEHGASLIMNAIYGPICYYPITGISLTAWADKTKRGSSIDISTIQNIFHKPTQYAEEHECRFALIINMCDLNYPDKIICASEVARRLIHPRLIDNSHYIENVYKNVNGVCEEYQWMN